MPCKFMVLTAFAAMHSSIAKYSHSHLNKSMYYFIAGGRQLSQLGVPDCIVSALICFHDQWTQLCGGSMQAAVSAMWGKLLQVVPSRHHFRRIFYVHSIVNSWTNSTCCCKCRLVGMSTAQLSAKRGNTLILDVYLLYGALPDKYFKVVSINRSYTTVACHALHIPLVRIRQWLETVIHWYQLLQYRFH